MSEFTQLRKMAREKRDKAIALAEGVYSETLARIAALEQDLLGKEASNHKPMTECLERVLPADRTFTTDDVMAALRTLDPNRVWNKHAVDAQIGRLCKKGIVRRIQRARGRATRALYARLGMETPPVPFEGQTLGDAMVRVLKEAGPLNIAEIAIALLERGYETKMSHKFLRNTIRRRLLVKHGPFVNVAGDKWAAAMPPHPSRNKLTNSTLP